MRKYLLLILFQTVSVLSYGQEVDRELSYDQIFDNREYFTPYGYAQTIFASRLNGVLIFHVDSCHSFAAGLNYMLEMGSEPPGIFPQVNLYYAYSSERFRMYFGSFSRRQKISLPLAFITDTIDYYRPNIEGALLSYKLSWLEADAFIDWTGRISDTRRESFLLGLDSRLRRGSFYLRPSFLMYHNARTASRFDSIHIQDNGIMMLLAGYDAEPGEDFTANIQAGLLSSYNRIRPASFEWSSGLLVLMDVRYHSIGLSGSYYYGKAIDFAYGDPFYAYGNYGRTDLYLSPFRRGKVQSKFAWCFHILPGEGLYHSQQILIQVEF